MDAETGDERRMMVKVIKQITNILMI